MIDIVHMNSDEVCDLVQQALPHATENAVLTLIAEWMNENDLTLDDLEPYLNGEEEG